MSQLAALLPTPAPARESPALTRLSWWPHVGRALVLVLLAFAFYRGSSSAIHAIDTWSHWKYGEWIWEHGRLPTREPFSPYSDPHVRLLDMYWLGQVTAYLVYARAGMEG